MNVKIEYKGYWWLPGADENRMPGILSFDPDEGTSLELMGSLKGLEGIVDPLEPEIILGISSDGKSVALKDCARSRGGLAIGSGFSTSEFRANTVFVGEHFGSAGDVGFERLVVEYLHLDAWAHQSGIQPKLVEETEEPKGRWMEMRHDLPGSFTAAVGNEYEVSLDFSAGFEASPRPFTWATFTQPSEIAIKFPEKQPFDRLNDIVFRLQHLFSLGMRRSAFPVAIRGYTGDPGEVMPVEVHYRPLGRADKVERPGLHEMLFSRRGLPRGFEAAVPRWLERAEKLDPVYQLLLGTVYNPRSYLEERFLSLVTALKVYHRRAMYVPKPPEQREKRLREILASAPEEHREWLAERLQYGHEPGLGRRLKDVIRKCPEVGRAVAGENSKERGRYVQKVADTRNYLTHRDESKKDKAARGEELYRISEDLRLLLEACLMSEIGFGDEEIEQAIFGVYGPRPRVPANSRITVVNGPPASPRRPRGALLWALRRLWRGLTGRPRG